tara:strand:+ start:437 stop:1144 length:708 start_codon:yes stop_codon:yes gene_type:complete
MSDIKKSDKWIGGLGILQALLLIYSSYYLVGLVIDLQEDYNDMADESCADLFFGCTEEEQEEIDNFMDFVQGKVIIWQAAWGFVFVVALYFLYVSFRLMTKTDVFRGMLYSKVPDFKLGDRQLFVYTVIVVTLILFLVGFVEAHGINEILKEIDKLSSDGEEIEKFSATTANGSVLGYCNTTFLFLILLIAFFTRDKPESDSEENIITSEQDNSNINNTDNLEAINMSEEQADED